MSMTLNCQQIQQRIDSLEQIARMFDTQIEQTQSALDQTRQQIELLTKELDGRAAY